MYPNFLGIGAQKAGTTWLYTNLKKHPDLWLPPIKELHYFNYKENNYRQKPAEKLKGEYWRKILWGQIRFCFMHKDAQTLVWNLKYFLGHQHDTWNESLFELGKGKVSGKITPDYTALNKESVSHIHEIMPNAKIFFMLRNPIAKACSYTFSHIKMAEESADKTSTENLIKRHENNYSRLRGNYKRALEIWSSFYPENQIFIDFFEEIRENLEDLLRRICNFLSVEAPAEYINKIDIKKVYSFGNDGHIPYEGRLKLAQTYREGIEYLSVKYGRYANAFLNYTDECLASS